jgi:hypothetical protein
LPAAGLKCLPPLEQTTCGPVLQRAIAHIALLDNTSLTNLLARVTQETDAAIKASAEKLARATAAAKAAAEKADAATKDLAALVIVLDRAVPSALAETRGGRWKDEGFWAGLDAPVKAAQAVVAAHAALSDLRRTAERAATIASKASEALEDQRKRAAVFSDTVKDICDASSWAAGVMGPDGIKELEPLVMWAFDFIAGLPYEHQIEAFKQAAAEQKPSNECLSELVKFHARELNGSSVAALSLIMSSYISKTLLWPTPK